MFVLYITCRLLHHWLNRGGNVGIKDCTRASVMEPAEDMLPEDTQIGQGWAMTRLKNGCMCMAIPGSLLKEPGQQTNPSVPLSFLGVTWMKFDSCTNFAHCGFMVPCIELCQAATCPIGKGVAACGPSSGSVEGGRGSPRETPRPLWDQRIAGKPESQGIEKANFAKEAESRNYVAITSKLRRNPPPLGAGP